MGLWLIFYSYQNPDFNSGSINTIRSLNLDSNSYPYPDPNAKPKCNLNLKCDVKCNLYIFDEIEPEVNVMSPY